ncbi:MAG: SPOR domain-containing protein [Rhodospirillales bacterium]|nr:SPOR domain-containing protein [Rhodospirillales bacterium]
MNALSARLCAIPVVLALSAFSLGAEAAPREYWAQIAVANQNLMAQQRLQQIAASIPAVREARDAGRTKVVQYSGPKGEWWRVRVGPFAQRDEAVRFCQDLRASGQSCIVPSFVD